MSLNLKLLNSMITLFFSVCVMTAFVSLGIAAEKTVVPRVIARVNGAPIYNTDIPGNIESRIVKYQRLGSELTTDELRRQFQLKELDGLIGRELLIQAGASLKLKDIEQRLEKRMAANNSNEKQKQSKEHMEALKTKLRKEVLIEAYLESAGLLNPKIDEDELRLFYDKNRKSFTEPESVKARHILIQIPKNATSAQEQKAWEKARKILTELKQGKDFAALAKENSDCSSKQNGGDLGFIKPDYMPKEFNAVAFKLKPNEISDIVKTKHGLHIIRVEEIKPEHVKPFEESRDFIAGYLKKDHQRIKMDELIDKLRKSSRVEILIK